jgi:hypothetical protein
MLNGLFSSLHSITTISEILQGALELASDSPIPSSVGDRSPETIWTASSASLDDYVFDEATTDHGTFAASGSQYYVDDQFILLQEAHVRE